ncbi:MAG TPA: hypothetical protein VKZ44_05415 [Taishania sp.]|nr:hypothetical protein [Taishania sp.]
MSELDMLITKIFSEHKDKIIDLVINQVLEDVMDIVIDEFYKQSPQTPLLSSHRELLEKVIKRLRPKELSPLHEDYVDHKWKK